MKWMNYGECLSIRVNLVLKPYYEDYQSLLFYEELDKVKFSLSDQYLCYYNSFNNIGYSIFLIGESKHKELAFKLTEHFNSLTTIIFLHFWELGIVTFKVLGQHVTGLRFSWKF